MTVHPPKAFIELCCRFHQDVEKDCPTLEAMAEFAMRGLRGTDRDAISVFLEEVLGGRFNAGELKAMWRRTPADVYFADGQQLMKMLELIREKLRKT